MNDRDREALHHCESGLQHMWKGEVGAALASYDRAAGLAESEETRELITICKGEALIAADREGPEVSALPGIVMRRRSHRHVYMAASVLMRRFVESDDRKRAIFYGEIARTAAAELNDFFARATVLNYLGITLVAESSFDEGVQAFQEALLALDMIENANHLVHSFASGITATLRGTKILCGDIDEGIHLIETVIDELDDATERAEA